MNKFPLNARYVMNMVILQIDVQKIKKMKVKRLRIWKINGNRSNERRQLINNQPNPLSSPQHLRKPSLSHQKQTSPTIIPLIPCTLQPPHPPDPNLDLDLEPLTLLIPPEVQLTSLLLPQ